MEGFKVMEFKKFTSIENTYRTKFIHKFNIEPDVMFIASEKLDGANIQLVFTPNEEMKVGKRTAFLNKGEPFFDIWNTLAKYQKELDILQQYANDLDKSVRVYGELYGPGINNRVDYGPEKKIALFDMYIEDTLLTQNQLGFNFVHLGLSDLRPMVVGIDSLGTLLNYDVENMEHRKGAEGIVIQPFGTHIFNHHDERLILKKKSMAFEDTRQDAIDKGAGRAEPKERDIVFDLNLKFRQYITENRVLDIYAKYGKISEPSQIGQYIGYVLGDAKTDFLKDNTIPEDLDKNKTKELWNVGGLIVGLLKKEL
jgi:hypothetical protein